MRFRTGSGWPGWTSRGWYGACLTWAAAASMTMGEAPPVANAGGPYTVNEVAGNATHGGWTVQLDGTASTDDVQVVQYTWDLGTDRFDGVTLDEGKWITRSGAIQSNAIAIAGDNGWGERYCFSRDVYARTPGMAFEARVRSDDLGAVVGFLDDNTFYTRNRMPYALYFNDGSLDVCENGSRRGPFGTYVKGQWYGVRIELKGSEGARYYIRPDGTSVWSMVYDSDYGSATRFRRGADVHSGTFALDDVRELTAGAAPAYRLFGAGAHPVSLAVTDGDGLADTNATTVTLVATAPIAEAGGPYTVDETTGNASNGAWTVRLDGTVSSDDMQVASYVWDFGTQTFDGVEFDEYRWLTRADVVQSNALAITGRSPWGERYCFSRDVVSRAAGMALEATVTVSADARAVVGFKDTGASSYHYNQMPYALYFNLDTLYVYEDGSKQDAVGPFAADTPYRVRIELREGEGARYYIRPFGAPVWTLLYESDEGDDTEFLRGAVVYSGTLTIDDLREITAGPTLSWQVRGAGEHPVLLTVTDGAGLSHSDTANVTASATPPVADTGGPYSVDEISGNASNGAWTVVLDGTGSTDDTRVARYEWRLGVDGFEGTALNERKWATGGGVSQSNALTVVGNGNWGQRYCFSRDTCARAAGLAFEARVRSAGGRAMAGFMNGSEIYHSDQMPHALYFRDGVLRVYEDGDDRGQVGTFEPDAWYDLRIELKETQGARYYLRRDGEAVWGLVYDSEHGTDALFRRGVDVATSAFTLDHVCELAAGPRPTYRVHAPGEHGISLTVWDAVLTADTRATTLRLLANDPPVPDAGPDKIGDESNCLGGFWPFVFSAADSTDDHGIYRYEWDWDYDPAEGFRPSGATGVSGSRTFTLGQLGTNTVAVRVTDHVLQCSTGTVRVILSRGDPPTADAGAAVTGHVGYAVAFDGSGSTDDVRVDRYAWYFGDGRVGSGATPTHVYASAGTYDVSLVVYDAVGQASPPDRITASLTVGAGPSADAGGPYTAGAGGPPAYFTGRDRGSGVATQEMVKFIWDFDVSDDSDSDGDPANDMDATGPRPFHTYGVAGSYTARLSLVGAAGITNADLAVVRVEENLPPHVLCVPMYGLPGAPHPSFDGMTNTLKAIVRDAGALTYQWDFGDGTVTVPAAVGNAYAIETTHIYRGPPGKRYDARLRVWDSLGEPGADLYRVVMRPNSLATRTHVAIDEGLWWIHKDQDKSTGEWLHPYNASYPVSAVGSVLHAFEISGHGFEGDPQRDPYVETVRRGYDYLFTQLRVLPVGLQTAGDPDGNANNMGIEVSSDRPTYEGGMVMDAIASSQLPFAVARTGGDGVKGRFFLDILGDMADMYAWGQGDAGNGRGGWRYAWNAGSADNSICQWGAIGMLGAEQVFRIRTPQFVLDENRVWLARSRNAPFFGYDDADNSWINTTPSAMVQMSWDGMTTTSGWWRAAEDAMAEAWPSTYGGSAKNYYGLYALAKALRVAKPLPVVKFASNGFDWYNDPDDGLRAKLVRQQETDGSWLASRNQSGTDLRGDLSTAWAIVMLTPSLFLRPPVAIITSPQGWGFGVPLHFTAEQSFHVDPKRRIVTYEWDFNNDGLYDHTTTNATDPNAVWTFSDPRPSAGGDGPVTHVVRLRVTDDNEPAQTDEDFVEVEITESPHPPFARAGGPYRATEYILVTLDGSESFDIDPGDFITEYQWDLDNDGAPDVIADVPVIRLTLGPAGDRYLALRVLDNGVMNGGVPMTSEWDFTSCAIEENLPPLADPGGPYTGESGQALTLDGSGSSDPNGDSLAYAWDVDGDGSPDAAGPRPVYTWPVPGLYSVRLTVSDSLLVGMGETTVEVRVAGDTNVISLALTSPQPGAAFAPPAQILLQADVQDPGGKLARVEFYAGASLIGQTTTPPYAWLWSDVPPGRYVLLGKAVDAWGLSTHSSSIDVLVRPAWTASRLRGPGECVYKLFAEPERSYDVETRTSLTRGSWQPLGTHTADVSGYLLFTNSPPVLQPRFYRARETR